MADLTVNEKYPDSWRLDHPDFPDVRKTTFAKGVITEFQQLNDDPLQVSSMVKVEANGKESEFIPLFFQPKAKYWEDQAWDDTSPKILATAFNTENNYFEKAWMSFRGGDEVVVMLREGVPFAVLGFADGAPRIGEDIILVEFPNIDSGCPPVYADHFFYLQCSIRDIYQWDQPDGLDLDVHRTGPDGLELGLTESYSFSWQGGLYYEPPKAWAPHITGGNQDYCRRLGSFGNYGAQRVVNQSAKYYHEILVPVGPFLYIFQVLWSKNYHYLGVGVPISNAEGLTAVVEYYSDGGSGPFEMVLPIMHDGGALPGYPLCSTTIDRIVVRAAIYSPQLFDSIKSQVGISTSQAFQSLSDAIWGTPYDHTFLQNNFNISGILGVLMSFGKKPEWDGTIFKVRPHNPA